MTDVAIVGMSCRFPGATSIEGFRAMLLEGRSALRTLRDAEMTSAGIPAEVLSNPRYVKRGAPLEAVGEFDVDLFRLRPHEAASLDPQHYHLLECVHEALEVACVSPRDSRRRIGLFAGADQSYYALRRISDDVLWDPMGQWASIIANDNHFLATSIAYRLGLHGPAVEVQTACSTSLVAVHLAIQSLLGGDCDVAVAGGVSIRGPQARGYLHRDGGILSPTGSCRPFDKDADGTVLASGVGVVVLQRLKDARAGRFPIWAVVKGSAVNNDGGLRLAYSAPSEEGQADVVREAIRAGQVDPRSIGYVEAHGTGTSLGDVTEYRALVNAFGVPLAARPWCRLGSVKSNFGHIEAAAGVAGLMKAVLSVHHREIYPSLGFREPNPQIPFAEGPFAVAVRPERFDPIEGVRRAGVSSFGIGGTNCHVVIEEFTPEPAAERPRGTTWHVLGVSAATPRALATHARRVIEAVSGLPPDQIGDACFSMLAGRDARSFRTARVLCDGDAARSALAGGPDRWDCEGGPEQRVAEVVFALPSTSPPSRPFLAELVERVIGRVGGAGPSVREGLQRTTAGSRARRWTEGLLAGLEVALWLTDRGVRPSAVAGPLGGLLIAALARQSDLADILRACVDQPPAEGEPCIEIALGDQRVVVDLIAIKADTTDHNSARLLAAIALDSTDPLDLQLARCLAELWVRQVRIDWDARPSKQRRLVLPTYPYDRRPVWEPPPPSSSPSVSSGGAPSPGDPRAILAGLWCGVIGTEPEPATSFLDAGGDSLTAAQLATQIGESLRAFVGTRDVLEVRDFEDLLARVRLSRRDQGEPEYLLSPGQEALWFIHALGLRSPAYNVHAAFRIVGDLSPSALREAFDSLIARQGALRARFFEREGRPMQCVVAPGPLREWRYSEAVSVAAWTDIVVEHARAPLDLGAPPLLSVVLLKVGDAQFVLSVVSHHIVSDEWSAQLMIGEVLEFYRACVAGSSPRLKPLTTTFGREAERMRQELVSADAYGRIAYWRAALAGAPTLDLPCDRARPADRRHRGDIIPFHLAAEPCASLRALAQQHNTTLFTVLAAAHSVLLQRFTGQDDICVGTNLAGRSSGAATELVGLFTNTVPLRVVVARGAPFAAHLAETHERLLEAQERQLPLATLAEHLAPPRVPGRNPFFDVTIVLQNVPRPKVSVHGLTIEPLPMHNGTCKFDIELCLAEAADGALVGHWEYDRDLFDDSTIERLDASYHHILEAIVADPAVPASRIPVLSAPERLRLVHEAAASEEPIPSDGCWELVRRRAAQNPAAVAVIGVAGERWTYDDLVVRASALGERLKKAGAGPGVLIGVLCDRTERYVEALLAVLSCGAAFVPLDPTLPDARLADLVSGSDVHAVLVEDQHRLRLVERLEPLARRSLAWIAIDGTEARALVAPAVRTSPDLAYVVYTSGSTGMPKGAMVARLGMLNHLWAKVRSLGLDASSVVAQTAPICFDISIWQVVAPLLVGGIVAIVSDRQLMDVEALLLRAGGDGVTVLEVVPSYLDILIGAIERAPSTLPSLQWLIATGEPLTVETCRRWFAVRGGVPIINAYGPTECSDDVTQHVLTVAPPSDAPRIPIGRALPNVAVYILDEHLEPVPVGAFGEICIGGICVGLGYLGDPRRTAEAFVSDPFSDESGARLYRTGDVGRRCVTGEIEYFGRRDCQVKLRGVRIEIEEVEAVLRRCPAIEQVAAAVDPGAGSLVVFVELRSAVESERGLNELRHHAALNLPRAMAPSTYVIASIPRTPTGKIDRTALGAMALSPRVPAARPAPQSPLAASFAALDHIWRIVLKIAVIPAGADFFDLGGDSLKAMRIAALAQRQGLAISALDILDTRTLAGVWARCGAESSPALDFVGEADP